MSDKSNRLKTDERPGGDLRAVNGLGPESAKALRRMGIKNCAELAKYLGQHSAQELSRGLAEQGVTIRATKIENEDWLAQARKHSARPTTKLAKRSQEEAGTADKQEEREKPADSAIEVLFDVRFTRKGHRWAVKTYDERDGGSPVYHGIDPAEWANWILDQMKQDPKLDFPPTKRCVGTTPELEIEILSVQDFEAKRFKTLGAEVSFSVSGSKAGKLAAAHTPVWIHVHTAELTNGTVSHAASAKVELEPEVFPYTTRLEFPIPEVGRYELHTLVVLLPPMEGMAYHRGPSFPIRP